MNAQDFTQLSLFLKDNLSVVISREGNFDPNTVRVELVLSGEVISSDTVDITPRPEYEGGLITVSAPVAAAAAKVA